MSSPISLLQGIGDEPGLVQGEAFDCGN